ncbi:Lysine decarboxylase, constitutive [compost metagenome]
MLLDPIKVTLATPGLTAGGKLDERGIPAAVVSRFLWERGLVVEKTGLYSFLVLFSMGVTKGKWSTLVTELLEFKRFYDRNAPLSEALTCVAQASPARYAGMGLRDLCDELHACYRQHGTAKAMKKMFTTLPEVAMRPADAYTHLVRGEVEAVPIGQLIGRVAAVMLVPYPPGIPLIMPGERFTEATRASLDYLAFAQSFERMFPGFDSDVHGLQAQDGESGRCYTVECIKE